MVISAVSREDSLAAAPMRASPVRNPSCIAHRGASACAPENTLAAIHAAIAQGSDLVELDVQRTKDGALVLLHDTSLARTSDARRVFGQPRAPWLVSDLRLDEVRQLDVGRWKSPAFEGERVPTLREAVDVLQAARTGVVLEMKAPARYPRIAADITAELLAGPAGGCETSSTRRVIVESFDESAAQKFKTLNPTATVGLLGRPHASHLDRVAEWADQVNPPYRAVDKRYVAAVHEAGLECLVWTVNTRSAMQQAAHLEVDGIMTDRPLLLRSLLTPVTLGDKPPVSAVEQ
jgi:glycerophosphoryl diester phosphodiesterase